MQLDKKQVFESQETFYMTVFTAHCSHWANNREMLVWMVIVSRALSY
jgi:hypothetical protein